MSDLAYFGGTPAIDPKQIDEKHLFGWPIMTEEDEAAALDVIRNNSFSGTDITEKFQEEFAAWQGRKYALAFCNGTASLLSSMFALGLGMGDEIICPTKTYWGSASVATNLGVSVVFCNIDDNLSMDPDDIERCISPRTKAIMVVHYFGYPADMDRIMAIAKKHHLLVIEDVSHAQGGLYKGKKLGTFGDIAAMSMMSFKSFAAGEMGMMVTDNRKYYERAIAFAHYERNNPNYIKECTELSPYAMIALGGLKGRTNQICSALGRVQLKYYDARCAEIRRAMNYFWDRMEEIPGLHAIRVDESTGSNMAGWYCPHGIYRPEELGGLSVKRFCAAVRAEGIDCCWEGGNYCLHTHAFFKEFDLFRAGKPTRIAFNDRDVRAEDEKCRPSEEKLCFQVPWFKHFDKEMIDKYVDVFRKVASHYEELLVGDDDKSQGGRWFGVAN